MGTARHSRTKQPTATANAPPAGRLSESAVLRAFEDVDVAISGLIAASLVDLPSGTTLLSRCPHAGFDVVVAGALSSAVLRHKLRIIRAFSPAAGLDDMLIRIGTQLHLIRMIAPTLFLYLVADGTTTHFAALRSAVSECAGDLP
jgi:hypothetical protein